MVDRPEPFDSPQNRNLLSLHSRWGAPKETMAKNRSVVNFGHGQHTAPRYEGHPLSVLKLPAGLGSKEDVISIGLDISSAPVPQRRYAAEACEVRFDSNDVKLIFAQKTLDRKALDSALVIRMNPLAALQMLQSIEEMKSPGLDEIAKAMGITAAPKEELVQQPSQMANVVANLVSIAVSGYETCMDFYHASAFAMRNLAQVNTLAVEPIVRVDIQTAIFISMVGSLREVSKDFPRPPKGGNDG